MFDQKPKPDGISGSGPVAQPKKAPPPPFGNNPVTPEDDAVVQCAGNLYNTDLAAQEENVQTKGQQKGFTKLSVDGVTGQKDK